MCALNLIKSRVRENFLKQQYPFADFFFRKPFSWLRMVFYGEIMRTCCIITGWWTNGCQNTYVFELLEGPQRSFSDSFPSLRLHSPLILQNSLKEKKAPKLGLGLGFWIREKDAGSPEEASSTRAFRRRPHRPQHDRFNAFFVCSSLFVSFIGGSIWWRGQWDWFWKHWILIILSDWFWF